MGDFNIFKCYSVDHQRRTKVYLKDFASNIKHIITNCLTSITPEIIREPLVF